MPRGHWVGHFAEDEAEAFFRSRGATVVARNWRGGGGELDLVVDDGADLVFVEVKARTTGAYGPGHAIPDWKRRRVESAARAFMARRKGPGRPCRIDVLVLTRHGLAWEIEHIPDAWEAAS